MVGDLLSVFNAVTSDLSPFVEKLRKFMFQITRSLVKETGTQPPHGEARLASKYKEPYRFFLRSIWKCLRAFPAVKTKFLLR
jgi:hypothetical protein